MDADAEVLITIDREKLPPGIAAMTDPALPVPAGVTFFEKRAGIVDALSAGAWAGGFALVGVLAVIFGVADLIHPSGPVTVSSGSSALPLGFGLVCCLTAWVMSTTAIERLRLRSDQAAGRPTRVGIYLSGDTLTEVTESAYTIIPRKQCRGVSGRSVRYDVKGQEKTFNLPADVIGHTADEMSRAVARWAGD